MSISRAKGQLATVGAAQLTEHKSTAHNRSQGNNLPANFAKWRTYPYYRNHLLYSKFLREKKI